MVVASLDRDDGFVNVRKGNVACTAGYAAVKEIDRVTKLADVEADGVGEEEFVESPEGIVLCGVGDSPGEQNGAEALDCEDWPYIMWMLFHEPWEPVQDVAVARCSLDVPNW